MLSSYAFYAANQILNPAGELIQVNYMYTIKPENPVMALFWSLIPCQFWYLMPALLIILVYLLLVYCKQIFLLFKRKAKAS